VPRSLTRATALDAIRRCFLCVLARLLQGQQDKADADNHAQQVCRVCGCVRVGRAFVAAQERIVALARRALLHGARQPGALWRSGNAGAHVCFADAMPATRLSTHTAADAPRHTTRTADEPKQPSL
jgi:hypothetical protein